MFSSLLNYKRKEEKMKETLEKLWNEYLSEKCTAIDTVEERKLAKVSIELHEKVKALLDREQNDAVEKYVDSLYEFESVLAKKAFRKGCEFAVSFLLESGSLGK